MPTTESDHVCNCSARDGGPCLNYERSQKAAQRVVKVIQDTDPSSPREWDNLGHMACWHRKYNLGDEQPKASPEEWLKANAPKGSIVLPLYLMDHSGISISVGAFGDPWDSGQVGWIVATPEMLRKNFGHKRISAKERALAETCLRGEVETYNDFLTGNTWGVAVLDGNGVEIDSCWGFFGDDVDGMKWHVPDDLHPALLKAWANRY